MADERIEDISGGELTDIRATDKFVVLDASDTTDDSDGTAKFATMQTMQKRDLAYGNSITGSATALIGYMNEVTVGSADIKITFPSSPNAGDQFGLLVVSESSSSGNYATAPGYGVEPVTSTKINNVSYTQQSANEGTAKHGLWQNGDCMVFRYVSASFGWAVVRDTRRPMSYHDNISALQSVAAIAGSTLTKIALSTSKGVGGMVNETNDDLEIKRSGLYRSALHGYVTLGASSTNIEVRIVKGSTAQVFARSNAQYGSGDFSAATVYTDELTASSSANTDISFQVQHTNSGTASIKHSVTFEEVVGG